jgi:hypothetical protein
VTDYVAENPEFDAILQSIGDQCVEEANLPIAVTDCD